MKEESALGARVVPLYAGRYLICLTNFVSSVAVSNRDCVKCTEDRGFSLKRISPFKISSI